MEMDLQIEVFKNKKHAVLSLSGEVDAYTSTHFRDIMLGVIEEGLYNIVIDMAMVEYIDSSGLGALVGGLKRITEKNGKIYIVSGSDQVKKVFEITGLGRVFEMFDNTEDAVSEIEKGEKA